MTTKQQLFNYCLDIIDQKIQSVKTVLKDLKETCASETKSTAGDKHETALAMLQIEQENKRKQLQEFQIQKAALLSIDPNVHAIRVGNGSLIRTDRGNFFISISLGKVAIDDNEFICLSAASPLGQKFYGCINDDEVIMPNGKRYNIAEIE